MSPIATARIGAGQGEDASRGATHQALTSAIFFAVVGLNQFASVGGASGDAAHPDNIIFDITPNPYGGTGISKGGFGHPTCLNNPTPAAVSNLAAVQ